MFRLLHRKPTIKVVKPAAIPIPIVESPNWKVEYETLWQQIFIIWTTAVILKETDPSSDIESIERLLYAAISRKVVNDKHS